MNAISFNRVFNPLTALIYIAAIILVTAVSIQLFYRCYRFMDMFIDNNANQVCRYFTHLLNSNY